VGQYHSERLEGYMLKIVSEENGGLTRKHAMIQSSYRRFFLITKKNESLKMPARAEELKLTKTEVVREWMHMDTTGYWDVVMKDVYMRAGIVLQD
jgi:hypothetical protein